MQVKGHWRVGPDGTRRWIEPYRKTPPLSKGATTLLRAVTLSNDPEGVVAAGIPEKKLVAELVAAGLVTARVVLDGDSGYMARLKAVD